MVGNSKILARHERLTWDEKDFFNEKIPQLDESFSLRDKRNLITAHRANFQDSFFSKLRVPATKNDKDKTLPNMPFFKKEICEIISENQVYTELP
jgi:hypothetical protein